MRVNYTDKANCKRKSLISATVNNIVTITRNVASIFSNILQIISIKHWICIKYKIYSSVPKFFNRYFAFVVEFSSYFLRAILNASGINDVTLPSSYKKAI